mmetsp:Transcript_59565/g.169267  ORF Transcript_59565/g.169267 Transcript_59565/m.169267 type:complete len:217 (-) Transcript_59565:171-821(-)
MELRAHGLRGEAPLLGQHPLLGSLDVALSVHNCHLLVFLLLHLVDLLLELGRLLRGGLQDALPAVLDHPLRHLLVHLLQLRDLTRRPAVGPLAVLRLQLGHPLRHLLALGPQALALGRGPLHLPPLLVVGDELVHPLGDRLVLFEHVLHRLLGPLEGDVLLHALPPLLPGQLAVVLAPRGGALWQDAEGTRLEVDGHLLAGVQEGELVDRGGAGLQ